MADQNKNRPSKDDDQDRPDSATSRSAAGGHPGGMADEDELTRGTGTNRGSRSGTGNR